MCPARNTIKDKMLEEGVIDKFNNIKNMNAVGKWAKLALKTAREKYQVNVEFRPFFTQGNKLMFNDNFFDIVDNARGLKKREEVESEDAKFENLTDKDREEAKTPEVNRMQSDNKTIVQGEQGVMDFGILNNTFNQMVEDETIKTICK